MKIKNITFLLLIFVLCSCSGSERFGITQKYKCADDEKSVAVSQMFVDKYEPVINIDTFNIPLNRVISSKKYHIYIGVSFNADNETLFNSYSNQVDYKILDHRSNADSTEFVFRVNNRFFNTLIYRSIKDKLTYVLTLETDSATVLEKYESYFLSKKVSDE